MPGFRATLILAFIVGLTSLVYEVIATKTLFFFFVEDSYSVGIVLATFLIGLAGGTLVFRALHARMKAWTLVFLSQMLAGVYALVEFANFGWLPVVLDALEKALPNTWTFVVLKMLLSAVHVGVPAVLMGVVFPLVLTRGADEKKTAVGISWVYVLDLVGSAIGALLAGVLALPVLGLETTVYLTAMLNFAVAVWASLARRLWPAVPVAAGAVVVAIWLAVSGMGAPESTQERADSPSWLDEDSWVFFDVIERKNSPHGVITVSEHPELGKILYVNYRVLCVENKNDSEYEMGALVGLVFEQRQLEDRRVLSVGLGCGYTLLALAGSPSLDPVDVVEINPAVIELARRHFAESTENVFEWDKVDIIEDEGFHHVRTTDRKYAAVVVDIENPSVVHSSPLYTDEFFAATKEKLDPDGLVAIWAYRGDEEYCKVLYNTLRRHFAHIVIRSNIDGNYVFFASQDPLPEIMQTPRELDFQARVEAYPTDAINTLGNQVLQKLFKPREYFFLPDMYEDPYIPRFRD